MNPWQKVAKPEMYSYEHDRDYNFKETDELSVKWSTDTHTSADFAVKALPRSTPEHGIMIFFKN